MQTIISQISIGKFRLIESNINDSNPLLGQRIDSFFPQFNDHVTNNNVKSPCESYLASGVENNHIIKIANIKI